MKTWKRFLALTLSTLMLAGLLAGCGGGDTPSTDEDTPPR